MIVPLLSATVTAGLRNKLCWILLLFTTTTTVVMAQPATYCTDLLNIAAANADAPDGGCGCKTIPSCSPCSADTANDLVASVSCVAGCRYCDKARANCGFYGYTSSIIKVPNDQGVKVDLSQLTYTFGFTTGRKTTVSYTIFGNNLACLARIGSGDFCTSCKLVKCGGGGYQPTIDCTNLEANAKATACTRNAAGGLVSIPTTAESTTMVGLVLPYLGCKNGFGVLQGAPVKAPVKRPVKAPVKAPQRPVPRQPPRPTPRRAPQRPPQRNNNNNVRASNNADAEVVVVAPEDLPLDFDPKLYAPPDDTILLQLLP